MGLIESIFWLTLNVYHEARSEPQIGQVAVAQVTLNRAWQQHKSIEETVLQPYQFSWTFQKSNYIPKDPQAFFMSMHSVYVALQTRDLISGATYYHTKDIEPFWVSGLHYAGQFGTHKYYRAKKSIQNNSFCPGQILCEDNYPPQ